MPALSDGRRALLNWPAGVRHVLVSAFVLLVLTGCTAASSGAPAATAAPDAAGYRGVVLTRPEIINPVVGTTSLRSATGATTLARLQAAHPVLLVYFGYTHCPDVCPTTMADIGVALRQLSASQQAQVQVAFVTTDPARDTPLVMKRWLANFDAGLPVRFVGLSASVAQVDSIGTSLGVPLAPPTVAADGSIVVEHGTQVLAFVGGRAGVAWLAGTTAQNYAHDLTRLTRTVIDR